MKTIFSLLLLSLSKSKPSGSKLSVILSIKSENISSIGLSEFKAIKFIIWGFWTVPFLRFTSTILKNENGRNFLIQIQNVHL